MLPGFPRSIFTKQAATCSERRASPGLPNASPEARKVFPAECEKSRLVFPGLDLDGRGFLERKLPPLMAPLRDFERMCGTIGAGDDAGFIYQIDGFGLLRELELQQEAGFSPIKVIQ